MLHTWWFGASMRDRKLPQSPTWCFQGCTNFWPFLAYIQRSIVAWPVPELAKWTPYGISGAISRNQVQRRRDTIWSLLFHNFLSCTRRNTCNIEKIWDDGWIKKCLFKTSGLDKRLKDCDSSHFNSIAHYVFKWPSWTSLKPIFEKLYILMYITHYDRNGENLLGQNQSWMLMAWHRWHKFGKFGLLLFFFPVVTSLLPGLVRILAPSLSS